MGSFIGMNLKIINGILERLNSLIQSAKSKARGFKTFQSLKVVIYLVTGDLNFTKMNASYEALPQNKYPFKMRKNPIFL
jgi:hypothetical protein